MIYMCVCIEDDVSDSTKPRHNSTNPEGGIPLQTWGPKLKSK